MRDRERAPARDGKQTHLYEYVPGHFVRQCHVQEKAACRCGQFIATADPPARPIEGGHYGAGFFAHVVVTKCADATPLHRLAKQYQRLGIPMSRSTLTDLFHAGHREDIRSCEGIAAVNSSGHRKQGAKQGLDGHQ